MKTTTQIARGFTILEILIVLGIMSLLVGVGIATMTDVFSDAEETKAKLDIKSLNEGLIRYKIKGGIYPSEQQGLIALVRKPDGQPQPKAWKPIFKSENAVIDPWGTPYHYKYPGQINRDSYDIFSVGKDKQAGTSDDIGNWDQ